MAFMSAPSKLSGKAQDAAASGFNPPTFALCQGLCPVTDFSGIQALVEKAFALGILQHLGAKGRVLISFGVCAGVNFA